MTTKHQLIQALLTGGPLDCGTFKLAVVNAVEREDGSNHKFNVTGYDRLGTKITVFVATVD